MFPSQYILSTVTINDSVTWNTSIVIWFSPPPHNFLTIYAKLQTINLFLETLF
jgi:hypothetical protein